MKKTILAIETSCDETGLAVVRAEGGLSAPKFRVLKNLVSSQVKVHRPFGGVVPGLAKREHIKNFPILLKKLDSARLWSSIDMIAVTVGPGLEPALWTGITFAEELSKKNKKELIGANHLEGHLYSVLLSAKRKKINFPAIVLLVSGGHTALLLMKNLKTWKRLGETRDDAAGEAFDKVARMLGLPYPGGPEIERLALRMPKGEKPSIDFPRPMLNQKNYDFSFSGLKTSVFYYLRDAAKKKSKADIAASFQKAAIDVLVCKTFRAAKDFGARSVILCGGVAANRKLRNEMKRSAKKTGMNFFVPKMEYNNDNAAMIAAAGYFTYLRSKKLPMKANGDLNI
ncbi:MAG: tRNA (adenosine(37)-N6)-threonylcarbamoyltransferase complex transferase subunit TsaD [Candidatus Liptonbacteria bacterium]|nr:tRNA (adenosine(37)-N6)-threonylcarbamoyltransferase complex transferase subunit TsaD [Candidatus Liptonbacteria bacterium]